MAIKLAGYKCGMTRYFTEEGFSIPVTVVKIYYNCIVRIKKLDKKYSAQVSAFSVNKKKLTKPLIGLYDKLGLDYCKYLFEFTINDSEQDAFIVGNKLDLSFFKNDTTLNVSGVSKGKGFSGVIKRHNFSSQRNSHGNSLSHRAPGSIGQCQTPGRVLKGKKMAGHLGNENVSIKNLKIVHIYDDMDIILLKGSIPGCNGRSVFLKKIF